MIDFVTEDDPRVLALRAAMGEEMAVLYGRPRHSGVPAEQIDPASVVATIVISDADDRPIATAALRRMGDDVEVKRMFIVVEERGSGLADRMLDVMEQKAAEVGAARVLLHTGERQRAALTLYRRRGYVEIPIFEPYHDVPESVCFARPVDTTN